MAAEEDRRRRWEDMDTDCLVAIFRRLNAVDVACWLSSVCRSWRRASLDPALWRTVELDDWLDVDPSNADSLALLGSCASYISGFLRLCVSRGGGSIEALSLPPFFRVPVSDLELVSLRCPNLKSLVLPFVSPEADALLPEIIGRLGRLEHLHIWIMPLSFVEMAAQIGANCSAFRSLRLLGIIGPKYALAIVSSLPSLRRLVLDRSVVSKSELLTIIRGCGELEELSAEKCVGFDSGDGDILSAAAAASGLGRFNVAGSTEHQDDLPEG